MLSAHERPSVDTSPSGLPAALLQGGLPEALAGFAAAFLPLPQPQRRLSSLLHSWLLVLAFPPQNWLLFLTFPCHFSGMFLPPCSRSSVRPSWGRFLTDLAYVPQMGKGREAWLLEPGLPLPCDSSGPVTSVPAGPHLETSTGRQEHTDGETAPECREQYWVLSRAS